MNNYDECAGTAVAVLSEDGTDGDSLGQNSLWPVGFWDDDETALRLALDAQAVAEAQDPDF